MSELETKAVEILDKIQNIVEGYAPEVGELALGAVQVTAFGNILSGLLAIVFFAIHACLTPRIIRFFREKSDNDSSYDSPWDMFWVVSFVASFVGTVVLTVALFCNVFDVWNYVALFNPELALTHQITGL